MNQFSIFNLTNAASHFLTSPPLCTRVTGSARLAAFLVLAVLPWSNLFAQTPTVSGYNGTQSFVTSVGKDPDEPNACGVVGGSTYWFTYQPPTNAIVTIDTFGSSFNTVLGIYVDNGQNLGYASLVPIACNDNWGTNLASCVQFMGSKATNYYIQLDGVNAATGTAKLNYHTDSTPTISAIANKSINEDTNTGAMSFTISDPGYAANYLTVTGISTNQSLVANSNIVFTGTTTSRTVKVTPSANMFGTNSIMLVVANPWKLTNSTKFQLSVVSVNDKPITFPDSVTRKTGQGINIARAFPVRNDTDADGNALTISAVAAKSSGGVSITLNTTSIVFAASSATTNDWFTYTVSDGKGATATGTNFVSVATNGVANVF